MCSKGRQRVNKPKFMFKVESLQLDYVKDKAAKMTFRKYISAFRKAKNCMACTEESMATVVNNSFKLTNYVLKTQPTARNISNIIISKYDKNFHQKICDKHHKTFLLFIVKKQIVDVVRQNKIKLKNIVKKTADHHYK